MKNRKGLCGTVILAVIVISIFAFSFSGFFPAQLSLSDITGHVTYCRIPGARALEDAFNRNVMPGARNEIPPGTRVMPQRVVVDVSTGTPKSNVELGGKTARQYNQEVLRPAITDPDVLPKGTILHGMSQSQFDALLANGDMVAVRGMAGDYGHGVYAQVVTEAGVPGAAFRAGTDEPLILVRINPERASAYTTSGPAYASRIESPNNQILTRDLEYFDPSTGSWISMQPAYAYTDLAKRTFARTAPDRLPENVRRTGTTFTKELYGSWPAEKQELYRQALRFYQSQPGFTPETARTRAAMYAEYHWSGK